MSQSGRFETLTLAVLKESSSWNSPPSVAHLLPVALEQPIVILLDYNIKCISLLHYIFSLILCS